MIIERLKSKSFLTPVLLWLLFVGIMSILLQVGDVKYDSLTRTLIQWDGQHYLSIARDGYKAFPCDYNPDYTCGNIGWFPLYPMIGEALKVTGIDVRAVMIGISWLALLVALVLLFQILEEAFSYRTALAAITALLLFPSSLYYLTAFPYSVYLLLAVLVFRSIQVERYFWLPLWTGLLAVTYPSGIIIGLPVLWVLIRRWGKASTWARLQLVGALVAIGSALLLYCLYYWWKFDDFFLYLHFQGQSYYAHEPAFPLVTMYHALAEAPVRSGVFISLVLTIAATVLFYKKRLPVAWQLFMFGVLLFTPTMGTCDCYYRHIVVAFPLFAMIGMSTESRLGRWMFAGYALVSLYFMVDFFVPLYRAGMMM